MTTAAQPNALFNRAIGLDSNLVMNILIELLNGKPQAFLNLPDFRIDQLLAVAKRKIFPVNEKRILETICAIYCLCLYFGLSTEYKYAHLPQFVRMLQTLSLESVVKIQSLPGVKVDMPNMMLLLRKNETIDTEHKLEIFSDALTLAKTIARDLYSLMKIVFRVGRRGAQTATFTPDEKKKQSKYSESVQPHSLYFMCTFAYCHISSVLFATHNLSLYPGTLETFMLFILTATTSQCNELVGGVRAQQEAREKSSSVSAIVNAALEEAAAAAAEAQKKGDGEGETHSPSSKVPAPAPLKIGFDILIEMAHKLSLFVAHSIFDARALHESRIAQSRLSRCFKHPDVVYAQFRASEVKAHLAQLLAGNEIAIRKVMNASDAARTSKALSRSSKNKETDDHKKGVNPNVIDVTAPGYHPLRNVWEPEDWHKQDPAEMDLEYRGDGSRGGTAATNGRGGGSRNGDPRLGSSSGSTKGNGKGLLGGTSGMGSASEDTSEKVDSSPFVGGPIKLHRSGSSKNNNLTVENLSRVGKKEPALPALSLRSPKAASGPRAPSRGGGGGGDALGDLPMGSGRGTNRGGLPSGRGGPKSSARGSDAGGGGTAEGSESGFSGSEDVPPGGNFNGYYSGASTKGGYGGFAGRVGSSGMDGGERGGHSGLQNAAATLQHVITQYWAIGKIYRHIYIVLDDAMHGQTHLTSYPNSSASPSPPRGGHPRPITTGKRNEPESNAYTAIFAPEYCPPSPFSLHPELKEATQQDLLPILDTAKLAPAVSAMPVYEASKLIESLYYHTGKMPGPPRLPRVLDPTQEVYWVVNHLLDFLNIKTSKGQGMHPTTEAELGILKKQFQNIKVSGIAPAVGTLSSSSAAVTRVPSSSTPTAALSTTVSPNKLPAVKSATTAYKPPPAAAGKGSNSGEGGSGSAKVKKSIRFEQEDEDDDSLFGDLRRFRKKQEQKEARGKTKAQLIADLKADLKIEDTIPNFVSLKDRLFNAAAEASLETKVFDMEKKVRHDQHVAAQVAEWGHLGLIGPAGSPNRKRGMSDFSDFSFGENSPEGDKAHATTGGVGGGQKLLRTKEPVPSVVWTCRPKSVYHRSLQFDAQEEEEININPLKERIPKEARREYAKKIHEYQAIKAEEDAQFQQYMADQQESLIARSRAGKAEVMRAMREATKQELQNKMKHKQDWEVFQRRQLAMEKARKKAEDREKEESALQEVLRVKDVKMEYEQRLKREEIQHKEALRLEAAKIALMTSAQEVQIITRMNQEEARMKYLEERRRAIEDKARAVEEAKAAKMRKKQENAADVRDHFQARLRKGRFMYHQGVYGYYDEVRETPVEWVQYEDADGNSYFYDPVYGTTQYRIPADASYHHYTVDERRDYDAQYGEGAYDAMKADHAFKDGVNRDGGYWNEKGVWVKVDGYYDENYEFVANEGYWDENGKWRKYAKVCGDLSFMV